MRAIIACACAAFMLPLLSYAQATDPAVDIVIEADTIAPTFYDGRREPTPGSTIRIIAVVDGRSTDAYTYRWEIDGTIYTDDPVVSLTAPFADPFLVHVDVFDSTGARVTSHSRYISLSEPEIVFYPHSLLRGTAATAIRDTYILTGDEVTIHAVPYFMNRGILAAADATDATWRVGGNTVTGEDMLTLTLRREGGQGTEPVSFKLLNETALLQRAQGSFDIQF